MRNKIYFSVCFILVPLALSAQIHPPGYRAEFGSILQAGNMKPFWMISNQGGKFHPENSAMFGGIYISSEVERQSGFFLDSVGNLSDRFSRSDRLERSDRYPLSSGSLLYSGNARLIPKVAVSSDYILVPLIYGTRMTRIIQMITNFKKPSSCG